MKVAIVHEYLNQYGGAERVLEMLHALYPQAPIYTIVYDKKVLPQYADWDIRPSFVQNIPLANKYYTGFSFLFPLAVASFNLKDFDLVISNTHAWGKGINLSNRTLHICYCLTPMRYIWDLHSEYLKNEYVNPILRICLFFLTKWLRKWDINTSRKVSQYIAISHTVAERIKKYYKREAALIYPPCDTEFFKPGNNGDKGYYLAVSRLKAYKRIDIIVDAFTKLGLRLKVVGDGPTLNKLAKRAGNNIEFTGWINDKELLEQYRGCRAFIFSGNEDFGLSMAEAQACGKPVIAYYAGGAKEIVTDGKTGVFFHRQTAQSLIDAVARFKGMDFDAVYIRQSAIRFSRERFKAVLSDFIQNKINMHTQNCGCY